MNMSVKSIVFDLDDTICFPNHDAKDTYEKYGKARPNQEVIYFMKRLHHKGYHITISSARRMLTHDGDIDKIIADVGDVTVEWLNRYNVPYHDLQFGKPYSSTYYVDDKAMNVEEFIKKAKYL
jgi:capsule biosynthesis phosphatase